MSPAPSRLLRQWKARFGIRRRHRELTAELRGLFPQLESLAPSAHCGGFDSIFYLQDFAGQRFGALRLNNPHLRQNAVHTDLPRQSPSPAERINREWDAYTALAPYWLSPRPLWRSADALACSYSPHPTLRSVIEQRFSNLDVVLTSVFNTVGQMHEVNVVHLDLSPGNVLVSPHTLETALIDFEYQPLDGRSFEENCEFDWRHLVRMIRKRATIIGQGLEIEPAIRAAIEATRYRQQIQQAIGGEATPATA